MLIDLADGSIETSGGKAAPLAMLLRAGLPVPPGFIVPICAYQQAVAGVAGAGAGVQGADLARQVIEQAQLAPELVDEIREALSRIVAPHSEGYVAVRSSASTEDGSQATAAGQHDTFLAVRGADQVVDRVRRCWASIWSERAVVYRQHRQHRPDDGPPSTAVLVQRMVDADVAGVMFTGTATRIEASWGLGESVVAGRVTPDTWAVVGTAIVDRSVGAKVHRTDRVGSQLVTRTVPAADRNQPCLSDQDVLDLDRAGLVIERLLGCPQDVEWAIADGHLWILQARPITAEIPSTPRQPSDAAVAVTDLTGTPASKGLATGPVRLVHGPRDFPRVKPGDILVCRTTDPAWTALFGVVAAVVTETGGLLSHAAIVAREQGVPAVLAVPRATTALPEGALVTVDGSSGRIVLLATE
ncbi:MAG: PEP/pyruvate-binding domain-containing protein [Nakamurella sp.]